VKNTYLLRRDLSSNSARDIEIDPWEQMSLQGENKKDATN
jgi:hypothetical protein